MSVGPIPWWAIRAYAEDLGIADEDDRADFAFVIGSMDKAFLEASHDKTNRAAVKTKL